jgi:hypothetical protein
MKFVKSNIEEYLVVKSQPDMRIVAVAGNLADAILEAKNYQTQDIAHDYVIFKSIGYVKNNKE